MGDKLDKLLKEYYNSENINNEPKIEDILNNDKLLISLLKNIDSDLKESICLNFNEKENKHLLKKYTETDILNVFKICLMAPSGKSWKPIWQVLELLYQASFSDSYTQKVKRFINIGNYIIYNIKLNNPIIYSFGIGTDITFDLAASDKYNCDIYMYDPTPTVIPFMEKHKENKNLKFFSCGIATENTELDFYMQEGKDTASLWPIHGSNGYSIKVPCKKLETIMKENNHTHIDILKLDVEGMAHGVIEQLINETNIRPSQIVAEIEVVGIENPITYLPKVAKFAKTLKDNGYKIYNQKLIRKATIELIIVHESIIY